MKSMIHTLFILFLTVFSLSASQVDADRFAKVSANYLFELNKIGLQSTLEPLILEKKNISTVLILDTTDESVFYQFGSFETPRSCPANTVRFDSKILYDNLELGTVIVCTEESLGPLSLSADERAYIRQKKTIKVHNEYNWAPFNYNIDGTPLGFSIDYINLLAQKAGLKIEFVTAEWNELLIKTMNKKLDVMLNIAHTKEREKHLVFVGEYAENPMVVVGRKNDTSVKTIESLFGKKMSVVEGFFDEAMLLEKFPLIQRVVYKNSVEALKAVAYGEVDATFGRSAIAKHIMSELMLDTLEFKSDIDTGNPRDQKLHIAIRNDEPILGDILKKAMQSLSPQEVHALRKKWIIETHDKPILNLNKEQKEWLNQHQPIQLGMTDNWPPFDMVDNGKHIGIHADFIAKLKEMIGVDIVPSINPEWDGVLNDAKQGKTHGVTGLTIAPEYEKDFLFTQSYVNNPVVIVTRNEANGKSIQNFKRLTTVKGNDFSKELSKDQLDNILYFSTTLECFNAVLKGISDGYIGWLADAQYLITQNAISGLKVAISVQSDQSSLRIGVRKEHPILKEIVDKALDVITQDERSKIISKWVTLYPNSKKLHFTNDEAKWLQSKPILRFVVDPQWLPIESINQKNGRYEGMNADLLDLIASISGIKFELYPTKEWSESVVLSKDKAVDMMACVSKTPERGRYLNFSDTTIELTDGILMRSDAAFIDEIDDLKGLKVGVPDGTSVHAKLNKENPSLILVPIKGTQEAIEMLVNGKIDAYAGNLEVSGYLLQQLGLFNLKVVLRLPDKRYMHIGLQKNLPSEALSVINKAIQSISQEEIQTIRQRWVGLRVSDGIDYVLVWKVGAGVVFLLMGFLWWNFTMSREIKKRKAAQEALENGNLLMKQLLNSIPSPIFYKNERGEFIGFNEAYEKVFGVDSRLLLGKTVMDLEYIPQVDRVVYNDEDMHIIRNFGSLFREQDMIFADKQLHHTLYSVNSYKKSDGSAGGLIGIFTDITRQKELEKEARELHKHTQESIEYASLIQHSLIPPDELFGHYFSDYFTLWYPKDVIGGDIYLFQQLRTEDECLLMVIDCTGHGVPGAFVTMLVKAIERQMVANILSNLQEIVSPAKLLSIFNRSIKHLLKQENEESMSNAGFDGAIVYYNKKDKVLKFAGAETALFYNDNSKIMTLKGDRHSVGYKKCDANFIYTEHCFDITEGMQFYITTDGFLDQNGGEKEFPLGKKKFIEVLEKSFQKSFLEQKEALLHLLYAYQGKQERNDDITVVGFKI